MTQKIKRYGTSSMPCDSGIYVLHSEYEALEAECERLREIKAANIEIKMAMHKKAVDLTDEVIALRERDRTLFYELEGIVIDVEQFGREFDEACMNTIKRVQRELAARGAK